MLPEVEDCAFCVCLFCGNLGWRDVPKEGQSLDPGWINLVPCVCNPYKDAPNWAAYSGSE